MSKKSEEIKKNIEAMQKRNRKITMVTGIIGGVLGVGVGACSQVVTTRALQALIRPEDISDKTFRIVTKVGIYGIGSAVGTGVSKNISEPISAFGELLCTDPGYGDYAVEVIKEINDLMDKHEKENGESEEDDE